jgi:FixJ family two-component response regulator
LSNLWSKLSPREHEVAELLLRGCDQAEIAKELTLARRTVKAYFRKMFIHAELSGFTGIKQVKLAVMLHRDRRQFDLAPQLRQDASLTPERKERDKAAEVTLRDRD